MLGGLGHLLNRLRDGRSPSSSSAAAFLRLCTLAAVLLPLAAEGSFGGTPCRAEFGCHFVFWGLLLGATGGIPVSALIFVLLHLAFSNPARSKGKQALLGGLNGIIAFELAASCAALMASWGKNPWVGLIASFAVLATVSVLYTRSTPRPSAER